MILYLQYIFQVFYLSIFISCNTKFPLNCISGVNNVLLLLLCFTHCFINFNSLSPQSLALTAPESQRRSAGELCAVSPTPRTLQTPPPLFLLHTTPPPLSLLTPQVLLPLTTGSVLPPPGPCSAPVVWGPRCRRRRGAKMLAKPATGSG